jgi:hypothetical protein
LVTGQPILNSASVLSLSLGQARISLLMPKFEKDRMGSFFVKTIDTIVSVSNEIQFFLDRGQDDLNVAGNLRMK